MIFKIVFNRFYSDYLMPDRLSEMSALYQRALDNGYEIHSVISFWDEINKGLDGNKKYLVSRHDIDTDLKTTKKYLSWKSN